MQGAEPSGSRHATALVEPSRKVTGVWFILAAEHWVV